MRLRSRPTLRPISLRIRNTKCGSRTTLFSTKQPRRCCTKSVRSPRRQSIPHRPLRRMKGCICCERPPDKLSSAPFPSSSPHLLQNPITISQRSRKNAQRSWNEELRSSRICDMRIASISVKAGSPTASGSSPRRTPSSWTHFRSLVTDRTFDNSTKSVSQAQWLRQKIPIPTRTPSDSSLRRPYRSQRQNTAPDPLR